MAVQFGNLEHFGLKRPKRPHTLGVQDGVECPSCGRETLDYREDSVGRVYQCTGLDCLELFEACEIERDS